MFCTDERQSVRASGPSDRLGPMLARSFTSGVSTGSVIAAPGS